MDKLLVASEYTDPSFHGATLLDNIREELELADKGKYKCGMLLISKKVYSCGLILTWLKSWNVPTIIHSTNTGLVGSILEPQLVLSWKEGLYQSIDMWKNTYPEAKFVLRIDPIIPSHSSESIIYTMMKVAKTSGVEDVRFSIIDCYPFVRRRFDNLHLFIPFEFQYPERIITSWSTTIGTFARDLGMNINSCVEKLPPSHALFIGSQGCASKEEWATLGLEVEPCTFKQRDLCTCTAKKYDLLKGKPCKNNCMYCYYSKDK